MNMPFSGNAQQLQQSSPQEGWKVWLHGEWYAPESFLENPANTLIHAAQTAQLPTLLAQVDGYFSAVVYGNKQLWFMSDRLGMKPLYLRESKLAWATQIQGFEGQQPDVEAMQEFLRYGYFPANRTSLQGVEQVPAASVWHYDLQQQTWLSKQRYWSWSTLSPKTKPLNEAAERLAALLQQAVRRRCEPKNAILLSGGLDSRLVLAALPPDSQIQSFSFGKPGAADVQVAAAAAKLRGSTQHNLVLDENSWWRGREAAVWHTGGMANCMHLHVAPFTENFAAAGAPLFNGFAGDLIAGGSFIRRPGRRIQSSGAGSRFSILESPGDAFYDFPSEDPFWLDTRVRRFTAAASVLLEQQCTQRKPFLDAQLLQFLYELPDAQRRYGQVYHRALLLAFPQYFEKLAWQRTGIPIRQLRLTKGMQAWRIPSIQARLGWWKSRSYTDYPAWLQTPQAQQMLQKWMAAPDAVYRQYFTENWMQTAQRMSWDQLGRHLTLAIWLEYWHKPEKRPICA